MKRLFNYLRTFDIMDKVILDITVVYNINYYDGLLFQVMLKNEDDSSSYEVVAAGGRYDNLVSKFLPVSMARKNTISATGVSIAIEKIFTMVLHSISEYTTHLHPLQIVDTEVYVCSVGQNMLIERMRIASLLWSQNIRTEFMLEEKTNLEEATNYCKKNGINLMITLKDKSYFSTGTVKVKNIEKKTEVEIPLKDFIQYVNSQFLKAKKTYKSRKR